METCYRVFELIMSGALCIHRGRQCSDLTNMLMKFLMRKFSKLHFKGCKQKKHLKVTAKQADLWLIIYETVSVTNCHQDL